MTTSKMTRLTARALVALAMYVMGLIGGVQLFLLINGDKLQMAEGVTVSDGSVVDLVGSMFVFFGLFVANTIMFVKEEPNEKSN